ncbi:fimbrial protein [Paraburkholderia nemoris]|uniref:fimbrial protein n=1 Tax=Paraburkholderia nemoris TaxID=2793076 RepID=UPI0038B8B09E
MKAFLPALTIAGLLGLASIAAHASDGSVTVNGTVATNTCSINGTAAGTQFDKTVTLPTVPLTAVSVSGSSTAGMSAATDLQIVLTNCAGPATKVIASFNADDGFDADNNVWYNLATTGAAKNVEVGLYNSQFKRITAGLVGGNTMANNGATITNGNATLQYYAQYGGMLAQGAPQPGTVLAKMTYQLVYQ